MITTLKYVRLVASSLILVLAIALLSRAYLQYRIAEGRAIRSSQGIDSLESVRIGGIDQWIHVRGQNVNNPILLFIHGGPGSAFIPMARTFQNPWETYFTVVQWDQRGAGKTYATNDREIQRRTMSVPQMEQDALEVVNYLRDRFKRDRIVVLGHSWGSILGLWLAHEHPETIAAYVGVAQLVNASLNEKAAYEDALAIARTRHMVEAITDLESAQPYPSPDVDLRKASMVQTWQARLLGPPADRSFLNARRLLTTLLTAPEYAIGDVLGFMRGQLLSLEMLIPQVRKLDLTSQGTEFGAPIFLFQGRHDPYVRPALVENYAETITAPVLEIVWFQDAGHFPFFEDQERFVDALFRRVLPLADSQRASNYPGPQ